MDCQSDGQMVAWASDAVAKVCFRDRLLSRPVQSSMELPRGLTSSSHDSPGTYVPTYVGIPKADDLATSSRQLSHTD